MDVQAAVRVQVKYMNKQPKFFCENCNAEVRRDAVICPHCGRFFSTVRCPSCGFTPDEQENEKGSTKKLKKKEFRFVRYTQREADRRTDADPLPLWIYGIVLLLCGVLAAIFFLL